MQGYVGVDEREHTFPGTALGANKLVKVPDTHFKEDREDFRSSLDQRSEEKTLLCRCPGSNPGRPAHRQVS